MLARDTLDQLLVFVARRPVGLQRLRQHGPDRCLDVAALVVHGNDDGYLHVAVCSVASRLVAGDVVG